MHRSLDQASSCYNLVADSSTLQQEAASATTSAPKPSSNGSASSTATAAAARASPCQSQASAEDNGSVAPHHSAFRSAVTEIELPVADTALLGKPEAGSTAEGSTAVVQPSSSRGNGSSVAISADGTAHSACDFKSASSGRQPFLPEGPDRTPTAPPQAQPELGSQRSEQGTGLPSALAADMPARSSPSLRPPETLRSPPPAAGLVRGSNQAAASSSLGDKCECANGNSQLSSSSSTKADQEDSLVHGTDAPMQQAAAHEAQPQPSAAALATQTTYGSATEVEETQPEPESMTSLEAQVQSVGSAQPSAEQRSGQQPPAWRAPFKAAPEAALEGELHLPASSASPASTQVQQSTVGAAQEPTKQQQVPHSAVSEGHAQSSADTKQLYDQQATLSKAFAQEPLHAGVVAAKPQPGWSSLQPATAAESMTSAAATARKEEEQQTPSTSSTQAVQQAAGSNGTRAEEECQPSSPTVQKASGTAQQEEEEPKTDPSPCCEEQQRCSAKQALAAEQPLEAAPTPVSEAHQHTSCKLSDHEADEQSAHLLRSTDPEGVQQLQSQPARLPEEHKPCKAPCSTAQAAKKGFWGRIVYRTAASPMLMPLLAVGTCILLCGALSTSSKVRKHTH